MPDEVATSHDKYISNYLNTGKSKIMGVGSRELPGLHKDGHTFPLELSPSESRWPDSDYWQGRIKTTA
jgi:hypothetical protein